MCDVLQRAVHLILSQPTCLPKPLHSHQREYPVPPSWVRETERGEAGRQTDRQDRQTDTGKDRINGATIFLCQCCVCRHLVMEIPTPSLCLASPSVALFPGYAREPGNEATLSSNEGEISRDAVTSLLHSHVCVCVMFTDALCTSVGATSGVTQTSSGFAIPVDSGEWVYRKFPKIRPLRANALFNPQVLA